MMQLVDPNRLDLAPSLASMLVVTSVFWWIAGCGDEDRTAPPSLDGPSAMAMATRAECGDAIPEMNRFHDGDDRCRIGLIANAGNDRLTVTDLGRKAPRMVDFSRSIPSITHVPVGRHPIDVAASSDGTAGYTLNSIDRDISVVNLWDFSTPEQTIDDVPETPRHIATVEGDSEAGRLVVSSTDPNELWFRPGISCTSPTDGDGECSGFDAEPTRMALPGRPTDVEPSARDRRLYVVYRDQPYMSVVALASDPAFEAGEAECRGSRVSPPCEIRRVGLTHGCSDGVDNDGDGRVDQRDPQCWGPDGAESPDGIGRTPITACNDGEDNDGDGRVDREDPDCQDAADDDESEPLAADASFPCSDGEDDDGDGETDYPADRDCYGPTGRTEAPVETTGFESIASDSMGTFLYVVDRANSQVLIVDAERLELIDAAAAVEPTAAPFTDRLGVPVGDRPTTAGGFVSRRVLWRDPQDRSHGIVRHSYGAYAASDNGQLYYVQAVRSECEVTEPNRDELLTNREFRSDSEAFENSAERNCLTVPEFPLDKTDLPGVPTEACEQLQTCQSCLAETSFSECRDACEDRAENRHECRAAGRELNPTDNVRIAANPKFALRDARQPDGRIRGRGACQAPEVYEDQMRSYANQTSEAPRNFGCDSPLRPQPLTPLAADEQLQESSFEELPRARLTHETSLRLEPVDGEGSEVETAITAQTYDYRYRDETWNVTWEGVLPDTRRNDGLLAADEPGQLDVGGVDLCSAGVREGDRLIVRSKPESGDDAPEKCEAFSRSDSDDGGDETSDSTFDIEDEDPYRTFRIAELRPNEVQLEPLEDEERFAQSLPTRECFPTGLRYEIRAEDQWVITGENSGFSADRTSELGACVPRFGAESGTLGGRASTDELYSGPYFEFLLYDGPVPPRRRDDSEFSYSFSVQRFFNADTIQTDTILPSDVLMTPFLNGGIKLLVTDASDDFVYVRNLSDRNVRPVKFR